MRSWLVIGAAFAVGAAAGCVLGEPEDPGCSEDAECDEGYFCRAGACFRETSGGGPAPKDAGSDAPSDGGADGG